MVFKASWENLFKNKDVFMFGAYFLYSLNLGTWWSSDIKRKRGFKRVLTQIDQWNLARTNQPANLMVSTLEKCLRYIFDRGHFQCVSREISIPPRPSPHWRSHTKVCSEMQSLDSVFVNLFNMSNFFPGIDLSFTVAVYVGKMTLPFW